jgi:Transcription factor WhiB
VSRSTQIIKARATDRLRRALADAAAAGQRHHCGDSEVAGLWTSENAHERALAVKLCSGCPVSIPCWAAAAAHRETFGVWGGQDRTRHPNGKAKAS